MVLGSRTEFSYPKNRSPEELLFSTEYSALNRLRDRGELELDSKCGQDAVVNTSRIIRTASSEKKVMVTGCNDILKGGTSGICCVANVIK